MVAVARSPLATIALILMLPAAAQDAPPTGAPPPAADARAANGCRGEPLPDARGLDTMRAGLKLESPLNPYANARFRHYIYVKDDLLLTLRTTGFVENDEGFGMTQAFDLDRVLSPDYLLRFGNSVRLSEETDGVRWRSRLALYQAIDYRRAMRYELSVRGETDGTQPDLYGVRMTHRRSVLRDWLFIEFGSGLFWADGPEPSDRCDACLGASIGFEVLFGDAYDRALRHQAGAQEAAIDPR